MVPDDPRGPVSLRWHQFSTNLGSTSSLLRERNILTDITFIVEEKQVDAHRFILAASSPMFLSLLHPCSHSHPMVYLRGVSHRDLISLLDFMYKGEVKVEQRYLESFLNTAEDLKVKGLSDSAVNSSGDGVVDQAYPGVVDNNIVDDRNTASGVADSSNKKKPNLLTQDLKNEVPFLDCSDMPESPVFLLNTSDSRKKTPKSNEKTSEASVSTSRVNGKRASSGSGKIKQLAGQVDRKESPTKVPKTPAKSFNTRKTSHQVKSPIEEQKSLTAKRTSIYGKKQVEGWKTLKEDSPQVSSMSKSSLENKKRKSSDVITLKDKKSKQIKASKVEAPIPSVSEKQKATSASLESAIEATKKEIRLLEDKAEEDNLPSLADATDGTIAEVEEVLRLSQEVLGDFQCVDNSDDFDNVSLDFEEDESPTSSPQKSQIVQSKSLSMPSPEKDASRQTSSSSKVPEHGGSVNILTPVKKYQPSAKNLSIISLMLVKNSSNTTPWKCSICKKLFKSRPEAEEHIGLDHVEGKLK